MSNKYLEKIAEMSKEAEAQHSDYVSPIAGAALGGAATHALTKDKTERDVHHRAFQQVRDEWHRVEKERKAIPAEHILDYQKAFEAYDATGPSRSFGPTHPNFTGKNDAAIARGVIHAKGVNAAFTQYHVDKARQLHRALARKAGKGALVGLGIGGALAYGLHKKDKPGD